MTHERQVFIDLDGVLAKFELGFYDAFGLTWKDLPYKDRWELVASHPNFFGSLARGCSDLVLGLQNRFGERNVHILTSCPEVGFEIYARQKRGWVEEKVPELRGLVLFSRGGTRKTAFLQHKHDVLIDDTELNLAAWEANGGTALRVVHWEYSTFVSWSSKFNVERLLRVQR